MSDDAAVSLPLLVGIFVGGASSRMGQTKGLLVAPRTPGVPGVDLVDETIVERTVRVVQAALPSVQICLVGDRPDLDHLPLERLLDARENVGPLGGVVSLLRECERRGLSHALVLGSDFPYLTESLMRRLAGEAPHARVLAPFLDDRYQPLVARYSVEVLRVLEEALVGPQFGLQSILRKVGAVSLPLEAGDLEALTDWDTPEDVAKSRAQVGEA